jgi:glycosyltransferase involved in cell wall biosynthesis
MAFPTSETHAIQITRTVGGLARHTDVLVVAGALTVGADEVRAAVRQWYGVEWSDRVTTLAVSRRRCRGLAFPWTLSRILAAAPARAPFYTRSLPLAARLLRYRFMHRRRVFFESHKKQGYLREDPVAGSRYADIRQAFEAAGDAKPLIQQVYRHADAVFFLHRHSLEAARREVPVDGEHLWYGLRSTPYLPEPSATSFVFSGDIHEHKLIAVLFDALDLVRSDVRIAVYGGDAAQIAAWQATIAGRPCAARVDFHPRLPHLDLQHALRRYRFGIATQEGVKVVDYIENGVTPVIPDIPSYREVLDERHAVFFAPDDPASLAHALDHATDHEFDSVAIRELCDRHSVERRAETILARLME